MFAGEVNAGSTIAAAADRSFPTGDQALSLSWCTVWWNGVSTGACISFRARSQAWTLISSCRVNQFPELNSLNAVSKYVCVYWFHITIN
jgi:hypothetical protein